MTKQSIGFFVAGIILSVLLIIFLATGLWKDFFLTKTDEHTTPIVITLGEYGSMPTSEQLGQMFQSDNLETKIPMQTGETVIAVLNRETEDGRAEEQFIAFMPAVNHERIVYLTYINYDPAERQYKRRWNIPTAASRPETITMFSQDLVGDRNNCIIITGMNMQNEHTMTVFKRNLSETSDHPFEVIAEIIIDGSIIIQEASRSNAYHQGITTGTSYTIAAYGQDNLSNNILDQIETTYSYNTASGVYEQTRITRIPGSQIEQQRIRELLRGTPGIFEEFINDLWYFTSSQGTTDSDQYIYFDPIGREIIFYSDEAQQIFTWRSSSYTRYGLYIRSQNISITTLVRFIDIELDSLDSIKVRVVEDVRSRMHALTSWDGTYRRAKAAFQQDTEPSVRPGINAQYDSSWGRFQFQASGEYTITSGGLTASSTVRNGHYVFFKVNDQELLELRPLEEIAFEDRMTYKVENTDGGIILSRIRLSTNGIQELYEAPIILTQVE